MTRSILNCGYVPLVDSAPLIVAAELGFAADEGIELNLLRQPSWAALRDLLALGHLDVAHMLSPMPAAMSLGLSGPKVQIDAPMVLSANGTVLGVSTKIAQAMRALGWQQNDIAPRHIADVLSKVTDGPLRVGVPFPFSMHHLLFNYLVNAAPEDQAKRFSIVTTPPPLMAQAIENDELDVFSVGEPWGTVAVRSGFSELILPGASVWAHAPEKVLGMRRHWAEENQDLQGAVMRAVYRACLWLGKADNRPLASDILARSQHLDLPDHAIDPALTGHIIPKEGQKPWSVPHFLKFFSEATTFPWRSHGAWIGTQLSRHYGLDVEHSIRIGADCMRPDLYRQHLGRGGVDMPGASMKVEGVLNKPTPVASTQGEMILGPDAFFDGKTFDFGLI